MELIAHRKIEQDGMVLWGVATNFDCLKNYQTVFGDVGLSNLDKAIGLMQQDFYEIKRYFQYVGIFQYHHSLKMYTMKLFEPTSTDEHLDSFNTLLKQNWNKDDLQSISRISEEILNDQNLIKVELNVYDPIERFKQERGL